MKVFTCSTVFPAFCSIEDIKEAFEELVLEIDSDFLTIQRQESTIIVSVVSTHSMKEIATNDEPYEGFQVETNQSYQCTFHYNTLLNQLVFSIQIESAILTSQQIAFECGNHQVLKILMKPGIEFSCGEGVCFFKSKQPLFTFLELNQCAIPDATITVLKPIYKVFAAIPQGTKLKQFQKFVGILKLKLAADIPDNFEQQREFALEEPLPDDFSEQPKVFQVNILVDGRNEPRSLTFSSQPLPYQNQGYVSKSEVSIIQPSITNEIQQFTALVVFQPQQQMVDEDIIKQLSKQGLSYQQGWKYICGDTLFLLLVSDHPLIKANNPIITLTLSNQMKQLYLVQVIFDVNCSKLFQQPNLCLLKPQDSHDVKYLLMRSLYTIPIPLITGLAQKFNIKYKKCQQYYDRANKHKLFLFSGIECQQQTPLKENVVNISGNQQYEVIFDVAPDIAQLKRLDFQDIKIDLPFNEIKLEASDQKNCLCIIIPQNIHLQKQYASLVITELNVRCKSQFRISFLQQQTIIIVDLLEPFEFKQSSINTSIGKVELSKNCSVYLRKHPFSRQNIISQDTLTPFIQKLQSSIYPLVIECQKALQVSQMKSILDYLQVRDFDDLVLVDSQYRNTKFQVKSRIPVDFVFQKADKNVIITMFGKILLSRDELTSHNQSWTLSDLRSKNAQNSLPISSLPKQLESNNPPAAEPQTQPPNQLAVPKTKLKEQISAFQNQVFIQTARKDADLTKFGINIQTVEMVLKSVGAQHQFLIGSNSNLISELQEFEEIVLFDQEAINQFDFQRAVVVNLRDSAEPDQLYRLQTITAAGNESESQVGALNGTPVAEKETSQGSQVDAEPEVVAAEIQENDQPAAAEQVVVAEDIQVEKVFAVRRKGEQGFIKQGSKQAIDKYWEWLQDEQDQDDSYELLEDDQIINYLKRYE